MNLQEKAISDDEIAKAQNRWKDLTLHRADVSVVVLAQHTAEALVLTDDLALRAGL